MIICQQCGHYNWERHGDVSEWRCEECQKVIDKDVEYEVITKGGYLTSKCIVPYEGFED